LKNFLYLLMLISSVANGQKTVVIAHRGGSSMAPENTIAAFKTADSINADYYELDVQISLDDSLMIMHDASVDRTTNGTGNIASMTYAQLRQLDAGSWFGAAFTGEKIPTLREALLVAKISKGSIGVVIELKSGETRLAVKTVALIQSMGLQSKVIVSSFNQWQIEQVKSIDPTIVVQRFASATNTEIDQVAAIGGEWIGSGGSFTQSVLDYAHSKGIKFNAWTINSASQMNSLIALGVDGITTDYPTVLISILDITPPTDVILSSAIAVENDVVLTWEPAEDPESGISGYEIYRDITSPAATLLASVNMDTNYIDKSCNNSQLYYYRIKARSRIGMISENYSNEIEVLTQSDITPPDLQYVTSKGESNTVIVEFNERVEKVTAETSANYLINNGVTVQGAKLALDQKQAILTTSPLSEISYLITVSNVQDKAVVPNTIVTTTAVFRHAGLTANAVAVYGIDTLLEKSADILVPDATTNLNNGKVQNGAFMAEGVLGNSIGFDGVDDHVQFNASPSFDINTNEVTISLWTKMDFIPTKLPTAYGPLFDSESDQYVLYEDKANGELRFKVTTSVGAERPGIQSGDLVANQWIYIVGVYNGSTASIYLNGVKKDSHPLTGTVKTGQEATLGKSGTSYFKGSIDQVEVYSRALSEAEILEKYNIKSPVEIYTSIHTLPISQNNLSIYPNPNNGQFTLDLKSVSCQDARIEVINAQGQIVFMQTLESGIQEQRMIIK